MHKIDIQNSGIEFQYDAEPVGFWSYVRSVGYLPFLLSAISICLIGYGVLLLQVLV